MKSNKSKLEVIIIVLITALLISVCVFLVKKNIDDQNKETVNFLNEISNQNVVNVNNYFNEIFRSLRITGESLSEIYNDTFYDPKHINEIFKAECQKHHYLAITMCGEDDLFNCDYISAENKSVNNLLKSEYVNMMKLGRNNRYITNSVYSDYFDMDVNFILQKIENNIDGKEYIISAVISSSQIQGKLNSDFFDGYGYSVICEKNGKVAVNTGLNKSFELPIDFDNSDKNKLITVIDENNVNNYAVYNKIGIDDEWIILTLVPFDAVTEKINSITITTVTICFLIVLFVLLFLLGFVFYKEKANKQILDAAYKDEITGYNNKQKFKIDLDNILKNNRLAKYSIVVLDIDNFKTFNDIFGFSEGDNVLKYTADIINASLEDGEIFCRSNSDNFYFLIKYDSKKQIKERLRNIMDKISEYHVSDNRNYKIISYCGVYKINPKNFERGANFLIDRARLALMRIVKNHQNGYAFYNDIFRNNIVFETELENDMEQALEDGDFKIYIQPKYHINDGTISGGEALIRWQHKTKGFLTPDKFIELFERNYFITKLDYYVLDNICKMQRQWLDKGYNVVPISVNQSRLNLFKENYIESILDTIHRNNISPNLIELEITEDVAYNNFNEIVKIIDELHKYGIKFSMDDFGSGYSSLNMLKNLDIDVIKLDRAFFDKSDKNDRSRIIVSSAIDMAKKLKIESVAEGVETQEHVNFLKNTGCNIAQGFFYSRPIPMEDYEKLIKN